MGKVPMPRARRGDCESAVDGKFFGEHHGGDLSRPAAVASGTPPPIRRVRRLFDQLGIRPGFLFSRSLAAANFLQHELFGVWPMIFVVGQVRG